MRRRFKRSFISICIGFIIFALSLPINSHSAKMNTDTGKITEQERSYSNMEENYEKNSRIPSCMMAPFSLRPIANESDRFIHGSEITKSFEVVGYEDANEIRFHIQHDEGIQLLSENEIWLRKGEARVITICYRLVEEYSEGTIYIYPSVYREEGNLFANDSVKQIFCVQSGDFDYMSTNSMDDAKYLAGLINYDGYEVSTLTSLSQLQEESIGTMAVVTTTVNGTILWTDSNGNTHPAWNMTVEVLYRYNNSWNLAGTVMTNANGYYSLSVNSGSGQRVDVAINIKAEGNNINVKNIYGDLYTAASSASYGVITGATITKSYTFDNSSDLGQSASVHQAMQVAHVAVPYFAGSSLNPITVYFPDDSWDTTCFDNTVSPVCIRILKQHALQWDGLHHEFGHYVAYFYGFYDSPGGEHWYENNLADEKDNKSQGIRLAWSEGWATYFAIMVQTGLGLSSWGIPNVGDEIYCDEIIKAQDPTKGEYSLESVPTDFVFGEANEACVSGILYDITDGISFSDNDNVYVNVQGVWNLIKNNSCTTLSEFITAVNNDETTFSAENKLYMGNILSEHMVSAKIIRVSASSYPVTVIWDHNSESEGFPNNHFCVAVYDENFDLILRTSATTCDIIGLSGEECNTIIAAPGDTVYCVVETKQTDSPLTGPYNSDVYLITLD